MAEFDLGAGISVEHPQQLFARGSVMRGVISDHKSPIAYGYVDKDLPIYFNQDPVLKIAAPAQAVLPPGYFAGQNILPNLTGVHISPLELNTAAAPSPAMGGPGPLSPGSTPAAMPAASRNPFAGPSMTSAERPRVIVQFPSRADDMLLSGTLAGGEALAGRALAVDVPLGKGHIVMFSLRPFWRSQTQGSFFLAFNAILNWDHLDAGRTAPVQATR